MAAPVPPSQQQAGIMRIDYLDAAVNAVIATPPDDFAPDAPHYVVGVHRELKTIPAPPLPRHEWQDLAIFRQTVAQALREYLAEESPESMLLIPAPPGSGKTWAGVEFAHYVNDTIGKRVLYAGPRTDFISDILNTSVAQERNLALWYDWKPRRKDDNDERLTTCEHAESINQWLSLGYQGMDYCKQACGWEIINHGCPYHAQKRRAEPLIYGNHLHVTLGHPLMKQFAVVIGDELPLAAFAQEWTIPAGRINLGNVPYEFPLAEILNQLSKMAESKPQKFIAGPDLLQWLGGADKVLEAVEDVMSDAFTLEAVMAPTIPHDGSMASVPANYLPVLLPILKRECQAAQAGNNYPHRLYVTERGLTMLTRRKVDANLPSHVVWFDATGTPELYSAMFGRPVETVTAQPKPAGKVYQVTDRSNSKTSLVENIDGESIETAKAQQLRTQINTICKDYDNPAVITYQALEKTIEQPSAHFYGSRGTNQFETCDVLVVAGTPQPPLYQVEKIAKCLWPERMRAFDTTWYTADRPYQYNDNGAGYAYPTSQFKDPDLNILLWQYREAEIIQAAHRSRMLFRDVPVFLLTNLPIDELPPTQLLTIRDLFGAPEGVNVFSWEDVLAWASTQSVIGTKDLIERFALHPHTARKYVEVLAALPGWEMAAIRTGRGRPQAGARKAE